MQTLQTYIPMHLSRAVLVVSVLALMSACTRSSEPGDTSVARLLCQQPGTNQYIACELVLQEAATLEIALVSTACMARGNTVRLTSPVRQTLTSDGCFTPAGTVWTINGVFDAGTKVAMEVEAPRLRFPSEMRVQGSWPEWTLLYEDGEDDDFDDLIMRVTAVID